MGLTNKNKITHTQNEGQNKQLANNEIKKILNKVLWSKQNYRIPFLAV